MQKQHKKLNKLSLDPAWLRSLGCLPRAALPLEVIFVTQCHILLSSVKIISS